MPQHFAAVQIEEYEETDEYGPDDFAFIIGPNGELKSFSVPQHLVNDPPEEVLAILKLYGIDDIDQLDNPILH
jgi:hypothetical protein